MSNQPPSGESTPAKKKRGRPRKTTQQSEASTGAEEDSSMNIDIKEEEHDKEERVPRNNNVAGKNASHQRNTREAKHPSSTSTNNLNFDPKEIIQASLWVSGFVFMLLRLRFVI